VLIRNLGDIDGDILLFGGPYSNVQALDAMMNWADAAEIPPERRICTGDVAAYCGDPAACIDAMRRLGGPVVAGNCEQQLARGAADCGCGFASGTTCSTLAKEWYAYADRAVDVADRGWMAGCADRLTFRHASRRYVVVHGGASDIAKFLWPISGEDEFWHEIKMLQEEVGPIDAVIAGHCGISFERNIDGIDWINAGVIGMPPNDGQPDTAFAVLKDGVVRFERLAYDVAGAARAMERAGLTQGYELALSSGYWPSQDILPDAMRH